MKMTSQEPFMLKLTPTARNSNLCYSTWVGEEFSQIKCTRVLMSNCQRTDKFFGEIINDRLHANIETINVYLP